MPSFVRPPAPRSPRLLPDHPVRVALLDLLAERGTVTATEAAAQLGHSSGLCSFHLRQLGRYGLIEEAPTSGGRAKPWRLRWDGTPTALESSTAGEDLPDHGAGPDSTQYAELAQFTRELENESYDRWLTYRDRAPAEWRSDDAFSAVVYLTPDEAAELTSVLRERLRPYLERDRKAAHRPDGAVAVAAISRVFPLLMAEGGQQGKHPHA